MSLGDEWRREEIETALGSKGRLRILGTLAKNEGELLTRYVIERETGLRSDNAQRALDTLTEIGWVKKTPYEPTKYGINQDTPVVRYLVEFLRKTRYI